MDMQEYFEVSRKYMVLDDETMELAMRQLAFIEFDAQVEVYTENGYAENNGGRDILDVTGKEIDEIIEDYLERDGAEGNWCRDDMMRNAIQDITGLVC